MPGLIGTDEFEDPRRKHRQGGRIRQKVRQGHPEELNVLLAAPQGIWIEIGLGGGEELEDNIGLVVATTTAFLARLGILGLAEGGFHCAQEIPYDQLYSEFLTDFAEQGVGGGLTEFHVSAGEKCVALLAVSAQQDPIIVDQGATSDKLYCLSRHV